VNRGLLRRDAVGVSACEVPSLTFGTPVPGARA
jgi:hypothetical protein